jgi:low affinity Fe/Cu permease
MAKTKLACLPAGLKVPEGLPAKFARLAADWTGSSAAFGVAALVVVAWAATGPMFHYSDTWQLVINTGTTIITFLMVFLIQRAQNKDAQAVHLKLNELVAAVKGASNNLINAEGLTEEELKALKDHYCTLVKLASRDEQVTDSHSVEEAKERHSEKREALAHRPAHG